ncbi:MAG: amino acid adenylation domain-containing protein [Sulfitobacter sp.]
MSLEILRKARAEGLVLYVEEERLKFRAKSDGPSPELRDTITQNKAALIAYLQQHDSGASISAPQAEPDQKIGPLSQTQSRIYYHETAFDSGSSYVMAAAYRFSGILDPARLQIAIGRILKRHAILRSRFYADQDGVPVQEPLPWDAVGFKLDVTTDLSVQEWLATFDHQRIDPEKGRVIDVALLHAEGASYLYVACHHIVFDGWSYGCFFAELAVFYEGGADAKLPDLPFQYVDFARWQALQPLPDQSRDYWRKALSGVAPLNGLPPDFPRRAKMSFGGQNLQRRIKAPQALALKALAQENGVSIYTALLSVYALVVARYADTAECIIGTPLAGRTLANTDQLIGLFSNVLPLRITLDHAAGFDELLQHVQQVNQAGQAHQDLNFEQIVQDLGFAGQSSFTPLCQMIFSYDEGGTRNFSIGGFAATKVPVARRSVNFEFELHLIGEPDDSILAVWAYAENLFSDNTVAAIADAFDVALARVLAAPTAPLKKQSLAKSDGSNPAPDPLDLPIDVPAGKGFADLFEEQVAKTPDACACVWRGDDGQIDRLTYKELNAWANGIASDLMKAGVTSCDCIAVGVDHASRNVAALLAVQKTGASHVVVDHANPVARNRLILKATNCRFMIGSKSTGAAFDGIQVFDWNVTPADLNPDRPAAGWTEDAAALSVFTSGSTGTPKGIVIQNKALMNFLFAARARIEVTPEICFSVASTLTFDAHMLEIFLPLAFGARLALFDPTRFRDGVMLNAEQEAMDVNVLFATPTSWQVLLDEGWQPRNGQTVLIGGEMVPLELKNRLLAQPADIRLINLYGPSECTTFILTAKLETEKPVHVGWPMPNTCVQIVDRYGNLCPALCVGELVIGGAQVARGYIDPDHTAAARFGIGMVAAPDMPHYKTGDLARQWPDGRIEIIGRRDFQVKHNGVRIELGEIEAALLRHSAVKQAVVVSHVTAGNQFTLAAYVEGAMNQHSATQDLRQHLEKHLPRGLIPTSITLLETMPLTPSGKIDRNALPAPKVQEIPHEAYPAETEVQKKLCGIWSDAIGHTVDDIRTNFFAVGGHSLLAIKLLNRVNRAFGTGLLLRDVIGDLSVQALANHIDIALTKPTHKISDIVPSGREGRAPLSFAQERMWAIDRIDAFGKFYTVPLIFDIEGPFDGDGLAHFLDVMLARHAILRSTYHADDQGIWQTPMPHKIGLLTQIDVVGKRNARAILKEAEQLCIDAPFDLATGPVVRSTLVRLAPDRHRWFLALHHIAFDGRSLEVLLYSLRAYLLTGDCPLPPAVTYADYAAWQATDYDADTDLQYWQNRLAGIPDCHSIPLDRPRPTTPSFAGKTISSGLNQADTDRLRAVAKATGATEFSVLFATLAAYLCAISDNPDIVIGTPVANRHNATLEHVIGNFVNSVALHSKPDLSASFTDLVQSAHRDLQMDMAHQELPFEKLVEAQNPNRDFTHSPIFQVMILIDNSDSTQLAIGQNVFRSVQPAQTEAKFDLTMGVRSGKTLDLSWNFATDIFECSTIECHAKQFLRFLHDALEMPAQPIRDHLPQASLKIVHGPKTPHDTRPFAKRFKIAVKQNSKKPALFMGDDVLHYDALLERAELLAARLRTLGAGPNTLVGLHLPRSFDMVIGLVAVHLVGAAHLPLDPSYPAARTTQIASCARPVLILSTDTSCTFDAPILCPVTDQFTPGKPGNTARDLDAEVAYVIYTSGSTGVPKGVAVPHWALCNYLDWLTRDCHLTAGDTVLQVTSLSFDIAITEVLAPLSVGARIVLTDQGDTMDAARLAGLIDRHAISVLQLVPTLLHLFTDGMVHRTFDTVRLLLCGGEAVPVRLMQKAKELFPNARLASVYGPTEATVWTSVHDYTGTEQTALMPLGDPLPNTCLAFREGQHDATELLIGGLGLAVGYLDDPERTTTSFIQDDLSGLRLYRTGDLVAPRTEDYLDFRGRADTQIKLHGHRIELSEIEAALIASGSARAVCLLRGGEIISYVDHAAPATLRDILRAQLPGHMIPSAFVQVVDFPLTPNGKIDRTALAALPVAPAASHSYEAPKGEIEETLAEIWEQVLERANIGRHDHFFAIGGHSLRAIRVVTILRDMLEQDLPVRVLFEHTTIATLATFIEQALLEDGETA